MWNKCSPCWIWLSGGIICFGLVCSVVCGGDEGEALDPVVDGAWGCS